MDSMETHHCSRELSEYVQTASFPECVSVTHGKHISKTVQISKGDIIVLKSCDAIIISLSYKDEANGRRSSIDVSTECTGQFVVLPPKESTSSRAVSVIMYPSISDLLIDSPTYFEATSSYEDPSIHGTSINRGDRFRYMGVTLSPGDGDKRLKVTDKDGNLVSLSLDCKGNFYPLEDDHCYTLSELISLAPVPRRLKLIRKDMLNGSATHSSENSSSSLSGTSNSTGASTSDSCRDKNPSLEISNHKLPFPISGVIHMLKPEVFVRVSPLNDPDTLWNIPVTANIHVRQYLLDDYEVPSTVFAKADPRLLLTPDKEEIPNFPAPPTPPMTQPLIPIKVSSFIDIYGSCFPVKAKIMDTSECNSYNQRVLSYCGDIIIHRLENTQRLYAKDSKSDTIYSLSKDAPVSFIEYPQKFDSILDLANVAIGTEIVILEDIASDFPKPFLLEFGDVIRILSNIPVMKKVKHTDLECKVLRCERLSHDRGSITKLKLPVDFEVRMMISKDHNNQKILKMHDLISGQESLPRREVAALLDDEEDDVLKDLPPNLSDLQILSEKMMIISHPSDSPKKSMESQSQNKVIGVSLHSGLVLAFRKRLKTYEADKLITDCYVTHQLMETLTPSQLEKRKQSCQMKADEDRHDRESVSSGDKYSTSGDSLQRADSTGMLETKKKKKDRDKIRRLSRALNPKHWRQSKSKSVPDPLPHPEAMGLMALAVRPHYQKPNDYQPQPKAAALPLLDQTWSSFGPSSDEEDEKNIYEDVDVGPIKESQASKTTHFAGPLHKSLPAPRRKGKDTTPRVKSHHCDLVDKGRKHQARDDAMGSAKKQSHVGKSQADEYNDDEHVYELPDKSLTLRSVTTTDAHKTDAQKSPRDGTATLSSSHYVSPLPATKPRKADKIVAIRKTDISEKKTGTGSSLIPGADKISTAENRSESSMPSESDKSSTAEKKTECSMLPVSNKSPTKQFQSQQERKISSGEPPVPPRRRKKAELTSEVIEAEKKQSSSADSGRTPSACVSTTGDTKTCDDTSDVEILNKENFSRLEKESKSKNGEKVHNAVDVKTPVPKPRGIKKRASSALVENDNQSIKDATTEHDSVKVKDVAKHDSVIDVAEDESIKIKDVVEHELIKVKDVIEHDSVKDVAKHESVKDVAEHESIKDMVEQTSLESRDSTRSGHIVPDKVSVPAETKSRRVSETLGPALHPKTVGVVDGGKPKLPPKPKLKPKPKVR